MPDTPNVTAATDAVLSVLTEGNFDYALISGLAVLLRGHDRFTQDIDALAWGPDERLEELAGLLVNHGFRAPPPDQLRFNL